MSHYYYIEPSSIYSQKRKIGRASFCLHSGSVSYQPEGPVCLDKKKLDFLLSQALVSLLRLQTNLLLAMAFVMREPAHLKLDGDL